MTTIRRQHPGQRGTVNLDAAIVFVAVVIATVLLLSRPGHRDDPPDLGPQAIPAQALPDREHVHARIRSTGALEVTHRVSARRPVSSILLTPTPSAPARTTTFRNIQVIADSATLATRPLLDEGTNYLSLRQPAQQFTVIYSVDPPPEDEPQSILGRELTLVPALRVDYQQTTDNAVRRSITTPGEVLNVACIRADTMPRPCGATTDHGWQVNLTGADRNDSLLVQTQLDR